MIELLLDPLASYGFMRLGLLSAVVVGVVCSVLSCLLVVRHQALLGDAISHAVLLGVAVGYVVAGGTGVLWGALAAAVLTGLAITFIERNSPIELDAVMGICFTAAFALGLVVLSVAQPRGVDVMHVLFGNVLGVSGGDLLLTALSGLLVLTVIFAAYPAFHLWSFDHSMARALGMRTGLLEYVFTALLAAAIVASLQTVGLVLVIALLITPGATAQLFASRLSTMMMIAAAVGLVASVAGLYASFYANIASGPAIVLTATALFLVGFGLSPRKGVLAGRLRHLLGRRRMLDEDLLKSLAKFSGSSTPATPDVLAQHIGGATAKVRARLRSMAGRGLVVGVDLVPKLTPEGEREAARVVRTHRLLERYVHEAEHVPLVEVHDVAEVREHQTSPAHVTDMDRLMGQPTDDPHGHPIPSAESAIPPPVGHRLHEHPPGVLAVVRSVDDQRDDDLAELVRLGLLPHRPVMVLARSHDHVRVRVTAGEVDLDLELASRVRVEPTPG